MFDGIVSENIVSDLADKGDFSSDSLCGNRLIGAFSTGTHSEDPSKDSLTGSRKCRRLDRHVRVAAPQNQYFFHIL